MLRPSTYIFEAKSAIDGLPRPSSISNLNCRSCNTIENNGTTVIDVVTTSRGADRISHSVPKILPFSIEIENKMGSRGAFIEETKEEDLNVSATNVLCLSMLQNRVEASAPVLICSERKRLQPSVLLKKGNTQEGITTTIPFQEEPGCFDVGSSFPDNINAILAPFSSLRMPGHEEGARSDIHSCTPPLPSSETQFGTDQQIMQAGSGTGSRLLFKSF